MKQPDNQDAKAIAQALRALVRGGRRGTMQRTASELGMTASAFRKRLLRDAAGLDEATIHAVLLIADRKAENYAKYPVIHTRTIGNYIIETRERPHDTVTTWRLCP